MKRETFSLMESYMQSCVEDSAHGQDHVYRVPYNALEIAKTEAHVDTEVLNSRK